MQAEVYDEFDDTPPWRAPAPRARRAATIVYGWQDPGWVFLMAVFAATPFVIAALTSPALLSLTPTVDMIAPIAGARAVAGGVAQLQGETTPFFVFLLMLADRFADAPGRIHLAAKAIAAVLAAYPLAYFAAVRLPTVQAVLLTVAVAAVIVAPFSGPAEIALAYFIVLSVGLILKPADDGWDRAMFEGLLAGGVMYAIWTFSPIFTLAGFIILSACPFITGRSGLARYVSALGVLGVCAFIGELSAPGLNAARAAAASNLFAGEASAAIAGVGNWGIAGVGVSTLVVLFTAAVFGGREHKNDLITASVYLVVAVVAAKIAGAQPVLVFVFASGMIAFSVSSPFYDGVFRQHDRASIAAANAAAALTLFWTIAVSTQAIGQLVLQYNAAQASDETVRSKLALVHPGGAVMAEWIEEGKFATPEAKDLLKVAPVDQSTMLLEAAARAQSIAKNGVEVAILTAADTACVIADPRRCQRNGKAAAKDANVVFVPRIDIGPATKAMKESAEALLYTEFKLAERTAFWDVWVRRGAKVPDSSVTEGLGL